MTDVIYFDTSALAKWYLNEPRSNDVEDYIQAHGPVSISDLTVVEMRALLARRRREKSIDDRMEGRVFATFREDMRLRFLRCHTLPPGLFAAAVNLVSVLHMIPIRSLDILHLAMAKEIQADILATADRVMFRGAMSMGFDVVRFD